MKKFLLLFCCLTFSNPVLAEDWSAKTQQELQFIHDKITEDHPGIYDENNPAFVKTLKKQYKRAQREAESVTSKTQAQMVLKRFVTAFQDGHLAIWFNNPAQVKLWPGFAVEYYGGAYRVSRVAPDAEAALPPVGSFLLDCDGLTPQQMMKTLQPLYVGSREMISLRLMLSLGWFDEWKSCRFSTDSRDLNVPLVWRDYEPEPSLFAQRRFAKGHWFSVPTFSLNDQNARKNYSDFLKRLKSLKWDRSDWFVFDVRRNGGGNSGLGLEILRALFGENFTTTFLQPSGPTTLVTYRLSEDNIRNYEAILSNPASTDLGYWRDQVAQMRAAHAQGLKMLTVPADPESAAAVNPKIVLLTDAFCASACLDFADTLLKFPNSLHVGQTTSSDTDYMEILRLKLSVFDGELAIPTKVYTHRERRSGQGYVPEVLYDGNMRATPELEKWLTGVLEKRDEN